MKKIGIQQIIDHVAEMCIEANTFLSEDMLAGLRRAKESEESENGQEILETMLSNFEVAKNKNIPIYKSVCKRGYKIAFVSFGKERRKESNLIIPG